MTTTAPVYVVDDDPSVREAVEGLVRSAGLAVQTFASAQEFLAAPRSRVPSCLVLDVQMPGLSGLDLQQELARADEPITIIFLSGHADVPMSVRAMKAGALEFLTKPLVEEDLLRAIQQAFAREKNHRQDERLTSRPRSESSGGQHGIVGTSAALRAVLSQIDAVAPTDTTVLVLGETGSGKELVARAIHARSLRRSGVFVDVNCAAIPQSLVASELFGHEKGAFTGALQRRIGRFEQAQRGTIFLDEIGDLPAETQVSLLRVLQERTLERVGGNQSIRVDVRVIAATNRDLQEAIAAETFRSDLFYRLNVFPIVVPALRDRKEDIPLLVEHFISRHTREGGPVIRRISDSTLDLLQSYSWPGNIRELQNVVERALIVTSGDIFSIDERWLSQERPAVAARQPLSSVVMTHERSLIEHALGETNGQVAGPSGAAARLGMKSSTLESKIRVLGIDKRRFKPDYRI
jgi:DNA-binding NtrC family response regulator